jgi:flagellar assembly factor FliW
MKLESLHLGELDISEDSIINFPNGIPGFEDLKQFTIVDSEEPELPFKWLQSIDKSDIAFVIINPFFIRFDYDFEVKDDLLKSIGVQNPQELAIFCIVVVPPENLNNMTINLKAPLIINPKERMGMQAILDSDKYNVRHCVLEELKKNQEIIQEVNADVSVGEEERPVHCYK